MSEGSFTTPDIVDFVVREIMTLSNSKSTGLDDISVEFLKISIHAHVIADILTFIMNCSIRSAVFIDEWKETRVTPLFKSGKSFHLTNYRPVSVLPVVS